MARQLQQSDLLVEQNRDGNFFYIKPNVGAFNARTATVDTTIVNKHNQAALWVTQSDHLIENLSVTNARQGISIRSGDDLRVYDYTFNNISTSEVSGSAIYRNPGHTGSVEFLRVYADGGKRPIDGIGGYSKNNTDFFDNNTHTSPTDEGAIFFRDVTAHNFGDGVFDTKSTVYIMNATIDNSFRLLRAHIGAEIIIVNSRIDTKDGSELAFLHGWDAKISYYNVLWNGKRTPDLSLVSVTGVPTHQREALKRANIIELDSNPLPSIDPFFRVDGDRYVAQVSINGGQWIDLSMPSSGYLSRHIGDTLVELPKLGNGVYKVRAWTESNGQKSGAVTTETFTVKDAGFNYKGGGSGSSAQPGASAPPPDEPDAPTPPPNSGPRPGPAKDGRTLVTGDDGNDRLVGDKHANRIEGGGGDDRMTGGGGDDVYLFDNRKAFGADTITDFNFNREMWFTQFVDLGPDNLVRLDKNGRFVVDGAGVVTIGYGERWVGYTGVNDEGYHVYQLWKGAWPDSDILPSGGRPTAPSSGSSGGSSGGGQDTAGGGSSGGASGGSGDQRIVVRSGMDLVDGGAGEDTIDLSNAPGLARGYEINLVKGVYNARGGSSDWSGKIADVENIVGSKSADAILGDRGDNRIEGGGGDDHIIGYGGRDAFVFDNTRDVGDDYIADFGRDDEIWLTRFVDLGPTRASRLDGGGGFWIDIANGSGDENRIDINHDNALIEYAGKNADGYFVYELA